MNDDARMPVCVLCVCLSSYVYYVLGEDLKGLSKWGNILKLLGQSGKKKLQPRIKAFQVCAADVVFYCFCFLFFVGCLYVCVCNVFPNLGAMATAEWVHSWQITLTPSFISFLAMHFAVVGRCDPTGKINVS